jgi:hypothetical protein
MDGFSKYTAIAMNCGIFTLLSFMLKRRQIFFDFVTLLAQRHDYEHLWFFHKKVVQKPIQSCSILKRIDLMWNAISKRLKICL